MNQKAKDLDKFYTHPDIAKKFVDAVNQYFPLSNYELVVEPSAGNGNILQYLPSGSIGLDIQPEGNNIIKQDFFEYTSPYHPLFNNISIACVGNPPFGSGYMNPLAKALGTAMQPRLRSRLADKAATAHTLLPPIVKQTQTK